MRDREREEESDEGRERVHRLLTDQEPILIARETEREIKDESLREIIND